VTRDEARASRRRCSPKQGVIASEGAFSGKRTKGPSDHRIGEIPAQNAFDFLEHDSGPKSRFTRRRERPAKSPSLPDDEHGAGGGPDPVFADRSQQHARLSLGALPAKAEPKSSGITPLGSERVDLARPSRSEDSNAARETSHTTREHHPEQLKRCVLGQWAQGCRRGGRRGSVSS
jgi:hypothetical protein